MRIKIDTNAQEVAKSLSAGAHSVLTAHIDRFLKRGAMEVAREARQRAPKAFSTLTKSIKVNRLGLADFEVVTGMKYARMAEEGARQGGFPKPLPLYYWIRVKRIKPRDKRMDERDLAFAISRSIRKKGTPAQPFMRPALKTKISRLRELIELGVVAGLRAMAR